MSDACDRMHIVELLTLDRVVHASSAGSKQAVLEALSARLAAAACTDRADILRCLDRRERSGPTGLGRGVAVPHGRLADLANPVAALMKLERGIEFGAPDGRPVAFLFAWLVPTESTDVHLRQLAQLAQLVQLLSATHLLDELRASATPAETLTLLKRKVAAQSA